MRDITVIPHTDIETVYVDWIITGGGAGGIVNYTLGTVIHDLDGTPLIKAASRVRLTSAAARSLANMLLQWAEAAETGSQVEGPPANTKLN